MPSLSVPTPLGPLHLSAAADLLTGAAWGSSATASPAAPPSPLLREAGHQVRAYFERRLTRFDLPLAPAGTAFQRALRTALSEIPFGETRSYGDVAARIGGSPRAVGGACRRNPLALIVPCHRVVGAGGRLTGYSGGDGLATKAALLAHEGRPPESGLQDGRR